MLATAIVTGQSGIQSTSLCEAWIGNTPTSDHTDLEHSVIDSRGASYRCGAIVPDTGSGGGFTITVLLNVQVSGSLNVNWVWN